MSPRRRLLVLCACAVLAACAQPPKPVAIPGDDAAWSGRLGLVVDDTSQQQNFSAGFELTGSAQRGKLMLYNPLGNVLAQFEWTPGSARMTSSDRQVESDSLGALIVQLTGNDLPIAALFGWLRGEDVKTPGWEADLSRADSGRIVANRTSPLPLATLRIVLSQ